MNFIWDLDGTLFDSYRVINIALRRTLDELGIRRDMQAAGVFIIRYSVRKYLSDLAKETGGDEAAFHSTFARFHDALTSEITLMPMARETLETLKNRGDSHFVATHRNETALYALENLGIKELFTDVIIANHGFARKPAPDSVNHLINKHGLIKNETFYVGDRTLDIECAVNAGIGSVLYLPQNSFTAPAGCETFIVKALDEIPLLPFEVNA